MTGAGGQVVLQSAGRTKVSESALKIFYRVIGVATTHMTWKAVLKRGPPYMKGRIKSVLGLNIDKRLTCDSSQPYSELSKVGLL